MLLQWNLSQILLLLWARHPHIFTDFSTEMKYFQILWRSIDRRLRTYNLFREEENNHDDRNETDPDIIVQQQKNTTWLYLLLLTGKSTLLYPRRRASSRLMSYSLSVHCHRSIDLSSMFHCLNRNSNSHVHRCRHHTGDRLQAFCWT